MSQPHQNHDVGTWRVMLYSADVFATLQDYHVYLGQLPRKVWDALTTVANLSPCVNTSLTHKRMRLLVL